MHQIRLYLLCTLFMVLCLSKLSAQTVIGGDTIDQSAILDIQDTAKGILLTRLSTAQRNKIPKPAFGLLILNTTRQCLEANIGSPDTPDWRCLTTGIPKISEVDTAYWNRKLNAGDTLSLSARINTRLSVADTAAMLSTYINAVDTAGMLSTYVNVADTSTMLTPYFKDSDTTLLNLGARFAEKIGPQDTLSLSARIDTKLSPVDTFSLSNRIDAKIGLPPSGNNLGNMLYWNGTAWVRLAPGLPGQIISLSPDGIPIWTGAALATVTTNVPTSITPTSAIVGGQIIGHGSIVSAKGIVWGTTPNPTLSSYILTLGLGTGSFSSALSGLSPNTNYYVRAYAVNDAGVSYGAEQSFITQAPALPSLSTQKVSNISYTSATSGGKINNDGGSAITAKGLVWATTTNPTLSDNKSSDNADTATYSSFLTGLSAGVTYYLRAYATNGTGTGYGNQISFTTSLTSNSIPVLNSVGVTGLTTIQATLNAEVSSQGGGTVTERGAVWNTSGNPTVNSNRVPAGSGTGAYNVNLTGLNGGSNYYFRAYAINNFGIAYGAEIPFTTLTGLATLTTNNIIPQSTTASSGGNITDNGGSSITARGVVWNTTGNPTLADNKTNDGTGTGAFVSSLTGLTPNTTYYLRAYATNSTGTAYGNELTFSTTATTLTVTDIDGNTYNTVQIGTQIWMSENLKTTRYRNGDAISYALGTMWNDYFFGRWVYYNHDESNNAVYGKLYNGNTVADTRGVCPTGWHVPTDEEWTILIDYLGGPSVAGGKMKATGTTYWLAPNAGATNESGFTALGSGECCINTDQFTSLNYHAGFFHANGFTYTALQSYGTGAGKISISRQKPGLSIRCLKD